ncbi:NADH-quinone oxidoreductase subunit NuoK [Micromonospora sp. NPDC049559]|uniref:NADH-quinone oxidoreductase subunit NuoK n=1 Tax=Micromonospora sp. NPDC049559 TaxID=3155923 RepID=UPI00342C7F29
MRPVIPYVAAALLFGLGVFGVLRRRNAVLVLMSVELMLNAVNLILVTASLPLPAELAASGVPALPHGGQVFALFVIVLAAAEVGVGLAIVLQLYRMRASVAIDEVPLDGPRDGTEPTDEATLRDEAAPRDGTALRDGATAGEGAPATARGERP